MAMLPRPTSQPLLLLLWQRVCGAQKVGDHCQCLLGIFLVNPMGAPIQGRAFDVFQSGRNKLPLQYVAARVLTDDGKGGNFRQAGSVGAGGEPSIPVKGFVAHEGSSQAAVTPKRRGVARYVVAGELAAFRARVHEGEHQLLYFALILAQGFVYACKRAKCWVR